MESQTLSAQSSPVSRGLLQAGASAAMTRWLLIVLLAMFAVAFSSTVSSWKDRQEMRATMDANISLRKTLGDLTHAITQKDREIDRLSRPCYPDEKPRIDRVVGR